MSDYASQSSDGGRTPLDWETVETLCTAALRCGGADEATAAALAKAAIGSEQRGRPSTGVAHLFDYLDALESGRLNGAPNPTVVAPRPSIIRVDADHGPAQRAFERVKDDFVASLRTTGLGYLGIGKCFPTGELGHYSVALAEEGFVCLAGTNSPPLMSIFDAPTAVMGTNPLSFAMPSAGGVRVIDQASSETAWVKVRQAARAGEPIPEGWAIGPDGEPTTDPEAALGGALLPFGGVRGSNIAVMVDALAALGGGRFSVDAASFTEGTECPDVGLWLIAVDPDAVDPGFVSRADEHFHRLSEVIGHEFGRRRAPITSPDIPAELLERLESAAQGCLKR